MKKESIDKNEIKNITPQNSKPQVKHQFTQSKQKGKSDKSFIATLLLCVFFGFLGIHRFYVGKIGTGLIWLFTGGLFGIGYITDIVLITAQTFEDASFKQISVI